MSGSASATYTSPPVTPCLTRLASAVARPLPGSIAADDEDLAVMAGGQVLH